MTAYDELINNIDLILNKDDEWITTLSNASAILNEALSDINWVGFYIYKDKGLYLGPFQGRAACTRISLDKGVCGYCARNKESIVVADVHKFPGHIACDSRSRSEICVPIIINGNLFGLLDMDSPSLNRFSNDDKINLEKIIRIIESKLSI